MISATGDASRGPRDINRIEILRGLRISVWEASFSTVHSTLTSGAFLTGFALWLGANSYGIGLLSAIPIFAGLIQIVASYLSERLAERKWFTAWYSVAGRTLWLPVLLLPWVFSRSSAFAPFLLLYTLSFLLLNMPAPAWMSWMSDLVPPDHRGRYFGHRNMVAGIVGMVIGLPAAWFLDYATKRHHAPAAGFASLFGVAVAAGLVSFVLLIRQPEPPKPAVQGSSVPQGFSGLLSYYRTPFQDRNFVYLMLFNSVLSLGQNIAGPFFTVYALQSLRLDYTWVQIFSTIASISSLAAMPLFGYMADKVGNRPLLAISVIGVFTTPISWMLTTPHSFPVTAAILTEMNLVSGCFWAVAGLTQFNLLIAGAPPDRISVYAATMAAVTGLVGGVSPLLGGMVMHALAHWHAVFFHIHLTNYHITFLLASVLRLSAILFLGRVSDPESSSTRDVIHQLTRANPRAWFHLRRLQEGSMEDRIRATEALGETRTLLAAGELQVALVDPSHDVRAEAAHALGEIGDPRSVHALLSALTDPAPEVVEAAIGALARIGNREANEALIRMLADAGNGLSRPVRIAIVRALGVLGGPDAADALLEVLRESDDETRETTVRALGRIGDGRAAPDLIALLAPGSISRGLRLATVRTLGELGDDKALPALRALIHESGSDPALLPPLADSLARMEDVESALPLLDCLSRLESHVARRQVAHAIGRLLGEGERVYALLTRADLGLDAAVAKLVGDIRKVLRLPGASRTLAAALRSFSESHYAACLGAIGRITRTLPHRSTEFESGVRRHRAAVRAALDHLVSAPEPGVPPESVLLAFALLAAVVLENG